MTVREASFVPVTIECENCQFDILACVLIDPTSNYLLKRGYCENCDCLSEEKVTYETAKGEAAKRLAEEQKPVTADTDLGKFLCPPVVH